MTDHTATTPPVPHDLDGPRIPLYTPEFAAAPHAAYRQMRRDYGTMVPVDLAPGVPATLVIGYRTALRILNDPGRFPADPSTWIKDIPPGCPIRPMMEPRPNLLRTAGAEHSRYRAVVSSALAGVDLYRLHDTVERLVVPLINSFAAAGECELISQYALPLVFSVLNELVGCPPEIGERVAAGMAAMFDTSTEATEGGAALFAGLAELVASKQLEPGDDITTRLVQHPSGLTNEELAHQLVPVYAAGLEPTQQLIANTLVLMLTDDRFAAGILGGSVSTRDALDEVLFNDPPMANFCMSYPRHPVLIDDVWLPPDRPVLISLAAANNDPTVRGGEITANRAHLAFGVGSHACPASDLARLIAQDAIDQLLDALPEIELGVAADSLQWRTGAFHRALAGLPVIFPPSPPITLDTSNPVTE